MKIIVSVKANAREEKVEKLSDTEYRVSVKASPEKGRANIAVVEALAGYFGVARGRISILAGHTAHKKIVEIL